MRVRSQRTPRSFKRERGRGHCHTSDPGDCSGCYKTMKTVFEESTPYWGGDATVKPEQVRGGAVKAYDPASGREVWSTAFKHPMVACSFRLLGDWSMLASRTANSTRSMREAANFCGRSTQAAASTPIRSRTQSMASNMWRCLPVGVAGWKASHRIPMVRRAAARFSFFALP
jgi:hypothetical protein